MQQQQPESALHSDVAPSSTVSHPSSTIASSSLSSSTASSPGLPLVPSKPSSSRYDYIKVRVHVGPHYHVLSRYLLARRLSFTLLPSSLCVHLALRIKKQCVDSGLLDLSAAELEAIIESCIAAVLPAVSSRAAVVERWRMVSSFTARRLPLLVLLTSTAGVGKSVVARRLANRLNVTTVIQTETVYSLCCSFDPQLDSRPLHRRRWGGGEAGRKALEAAQEQRCRVVRCALQHDISKCCTDGRPLLIEGTDIATHLFDSVVPDSAACSCSSPCSLPASFASPSPLSPLVVLAFVLSIDLHEQRMMMHDGLRQQQQHEAEEEEATPAEMEDNVCAIQSWMERAVAQQRRRWEEMKDRQHRQAEEAQGTGGSGGGEQSALTMPLVPQLIPLQLRCRSAAVSSMHTAVLQAISQYCR